MSINPETFQAEEIEKGIYWVGAIDWELSDFHGYSTGRGTTYNAYLIVDEKITLIDTVKAPFRDQMLSRISSVLEPSRIDYIVSNHSEMDHTGSLPQTIAMVQPEKVIASAMGKKALQEHFGLGDKVSVAPQGETVSLGRRKLSFLETRMLHWPDSMFSFIAEEGILFSQDGFGMHLASEERFADQIEDWILNYEAAKYFANILLPYAPQVLKLLEKVEAAGLSFRMILPDHGPVWRKDPEQIIKLYAKWARQEPTSKAVIIYDTMWGSTALMARAIGEGLAAGGAKPSLLPLKKTDRSEAATEILTAGALLVGSPTMNNQIFPTLADVMTYLRGLKPANLVGAAFGSYGWSGESVKILEEILGAMKAEMVEEGLKVKYVPTPADLENCRRLGGAIASRLPGFGEAV